MSATALPVLGPCQVWLGPAGAEAELGKTHDVHFYCEETAADITYAQTGVGPWDKVITGKTARVEADFANLSHALLESLINGATIYTDGATPAVCDQVLDIQLGIGRTYRCNAERIILMPYEGCESDGAPSPNPCDWIFGPLAYPRVELDWIFNATDQRVVHTIFDLLPESQSVPRLWFMGDETLLP